MRRFADEVHVRSGPVGGAEHVPVQFLWRGRLYVVHDVLACWRERSSWWEAAPVAALHGGQHPDAAGPCAAAEVLEREVWRVEASAGRSAPVGVYDLCRPAVPGTAADPAPAGADTWQLLRVCD